MNEFEMPFAAKRDGGKLDLSTERLRRNAALGGLKKVVEKPGILPGFQTSSGCPLASSKQANSGRKS